LQPEHLDTIETFLAAAPHPTSPQTPCRSPGACWATPPPDLNPGDLEALAHAVPGHARSDPPQQIFAVEQRIDQHEQQARRLTEVMRGLQPTDAAAT